MPRDDCRQNFPTWSRSLDVETDEPVEGVVNGEIPEWLEGVLLRIGPGIFDIGGSSVNHLFDGFSVLHKFSIAKGRVTYKNAALKSDTYLKSQAANRLMVHQFGTVSFPDPCKRLLGSFMSRFEHQDFTDNCVVNLCYFGDKLYTMTETPMLREVDPDTLDTLDEKVDLSQYFAVHHSTAHPHVDPNGTVYNMANSAGKNGLLYNVIRFPPGENSVANGKIVASFPSRWKLSHSYYHSFGISENYFIFIEMPLSVNLLKIATMSLRRAPYCTSMEWNSNERSRILLADRTTGKLIDTTYEAEPFFCFHHSNAYEKDGHLVIDLCYYDDATVITDLMLDNLKQNKSYSGAKYTRFVLPLLEATEEMKEKEKANLVKLNGTTCKAYWSVKNRIYCEPEHLYEGEMELPRINYNFNGKYYNYAYGIRFCETLAESAEVIKIDVNSRKVIKWSRQGYSPSEPVYVPGHKSSAEDDGVILFSALNRSDESQVVLLVILSACTFDELACVEFTANGTVPKDLHGLFATSMSAIHRY